MGLGFVQVTLLTTLAGQRISQNTPHCISLVILQPGAFLFTLLEVNTMAKVNAQQYAAKWGNRLKGATTEIRQGVEGVTQAPGQAAAKKADKMLAGIQKALSDGTWQRNVAAVSLDEWKKKTLDKGLGRISSGVDGAMDKQVQMAEKLLAAVDSVKGEVDRMPDTTLDDRLNRMVAFARGMSTKKIK